MASDWASAAISFILDNGLVLTFVTLVSFYLLKPYLDPRRRHLPPGPTGVPVLGYIPFMQADYGVQLKRLFSKYGKIMSMRLGSMDVVFISDFEVVKKIMRIDDFNYRPEFYMFSTVDVPNFVSWNGEEWKEQRKFSIRIMRDLGMGKQSFEEAILDEVQQLMSLVQAEADKPIPIHHLLGSSASNVLGHMIMGKSLAANHPMRQLIDENFLARGNGARPSMFSPFFYLPKLTKLLASSPFSPTTLFAMRGNKILEYMKQCFAEINQTYDTTSDDVKCFMEAYLKEMKSEKLSGKFFDEYHMLGDAFSFFAAGSNTTGDFMTWFFLLMMVRPEIQKKIRQEVDDVIGTNQTSAKYRKSMPYTEAVIQELHRVSSTTPVGLPHAVARDVWMEGFFLPKGTQVMIAIEEIHTDPDNFDRPDEFIPERHISPAGEFVRNEKIIPFGIGKRACPGEPIANALIFLYVISFMQKFEIEAPKGRTYRMDGVMDFLGKIPADSPVEIMLKRRADCSS